MTARAIHLWLCGAFLLWTIPGMLKGTIHPGEDAWIYLWFIPWTLLGLAVMVATIRAWVVEARGARRSPPR